MKVMQNLNTPLARELTSTVQEFESAHI